MIEKLGNFGKQCQIYQLILLTAVRTMIKVKRPFQLQGNTIVTDDGELVTGTVGNRINSNSAEVG